MSELTREAARVQSESSLAGVAGGLKCLTGSILTGIKDYWPLLLSSGLLYLEIRHLRDEIKALQGAVSKLADNVPAGRTRRSLSISSGADDWFSVKSFEDSDEEPDADECDPTLLKEIDTIHYSSDEGIRQAWDRIKDMDHSRSVELLMRKTRSQCSMYGQYRKGAELGDDVEMRRHFANQALKWAEELMRRAPNKPYGYRYKAAALGCMMEFFSVTEKVTNGKEIRNYLEKALEKDPKDGSAHYIFGRFHYEASNLPWAVRTVANRIGMPPSSESEALEHFDAAIGHSGHEKELQLYRYKILTKVGRKEDARRAIESVKDLPIVFNSEKSVQEELDGIWSKIQ